MSQKRLDYLDMAKGIGIFFVVLGHIEFIQESTLRWIFSFHMPLFFVVAGVLIFEKQEQKRSALLVFKKKAKGTLVPYVSFSLILLSMAVTGYFLQPGSITGTVLARQFVDTFTGYGLHILWFLPAYFLANAGFFLLNKHTRSVVRNLTLLVLAALALVLSRKIDLSQYTTWTCSLVQAAGWNLLIVVLRSILAMPFLLIGWYYAKWSRNFPPAAQKCLPLCWILGSLMALKLSVFDLHYLYVKPLHYVAAALSCVGILSLFKLLPVSRILTYLGRNSLVIMCTHASLYVIYYVSLGMFFVKKFIPMTDPVFNVTVAVLVCAAEVPVIWIFNRYFRHLLGKNNVKGKTFD